MISSPNRLRISPTAGAPARKRVVDQRVGVHDRSPARSQLGQHHALPVPMPPVTATLNIGLQPRRRASAARTVLASSMAMVSGPTPPGTGVMAPAVSATPDERHRP